MTVSAELTSTSTMSSRWRPDRLLGHHDEARALLRDALGAVGDSGSREAAELQLELAADRYFAGDWSAMSMEAEKAWRLAAASSDRGLKMQADGCKRTTGSAGWS